MKVLFVVSGLGLGNSTRVHAIIERLQGMGHASHVATSGNGIWYFRGVPGLTGVTELEPFHYGSARGKIAISRTLWQLPDYVSAAKKNGRAMERLIDRWRPDVVVTDSAYTFTPMRRRGLPVVALNNSDLVWEAFFRGSRPPKSALAQFLTVEVADYLFHRCVPDLVISPSLDPVRSSPSERRLRVGPIVRRLFRATATDRSHRHVTVMLGGSVFATPFRPTRRAEFRVSVLGQRSPSVAHPNATYHGRVRDTFRFLRASDVVVTNGGFSSLSEVLALRKPVVVLPIHGHFEQWANAKTAERLGVGLMACSENLEDKMFEAFERQTEFADAYKCLRFENGALSAAEALAQYHRPTTTPDSTSVCSNASLEKNRYSASL